MQTIPPLSHTTAVILCGGRATRLGGIDKGLLMLQGFTLVQHVLQRVQPQVANVIISANRNQSQYAELTACNVIPDQIDDFAGPLAGILAAMQVVTTPFLAVVPCDAPEVHSQLFQRLYTALSQAGADLSVAHDGVRLQPLFAILKTDLHRALNDFLAAGERKTQLFYRQQQMISVDCQDIAEHFVNLNTPNDVAEFPQ